MSSKVNYKGAILYGLYNVVWFLVLLPFASLVFWRYRKIPSHNMRFSERFTFYKKKIQAKEIWVHTASVGEVNAALPLLREVIKAYGVDQLLVTTTTPTGEQVLRKALGDDVNHLYLPFDQFFLMRHLLKTVKIKSLILFETEIWPSLIVEAKKNNVNVVLVNARMSEESKQKYLKFKSFSRFIFNKLSLVVAQTQKEADHFYELGAVDCKMSGSLKFSVVVENSLKKEMSTIKNAWQASTGNKFILVAGSTHPEEESVILDSCRQLKENGFDVLLVLAPRHVERSDEVASLCLQKNFSAMRYDENIIPNESTDVILIDQVGTLFALFGLADIAIMGGTFIHRGGHNFLEPAAWGAPIIAGKSDYNFSEIAKGLVDQGALTQVDDASTLTAALTKLLINTELAKTQGSAAKKYSLKNSEAVNETMSIISPFLPKK